MLKTPNRNTRRGAVDEQDPDAACITYAETLPDRFDLVHLGLGPDGIVGCDKRFVTEMAPVTEWTKAYYAYCDDR